MEKLSKQLYTDALVRDLEYNVYKDLVKDARKENPEILLASKTLYNTGKPSIRGMKALPSDEEFIKVLEEKGELQPFSSLDLHQIKRIRGGLKIESIEKKSRKILNDVFKTSNIAYAIDQNRLDELYNALDLFYRRRNVNKGEIYKTLGYRVGGKNEGARLARFLDDIERQEALSGDRDKSIKEIMDIVGNFISDPEYNNEEIARKIMDRNRQDLPPPTMDPDQRDKLEESKTDVTKAVEIEEEQQARDEVQEAILEEDLEDIKEATEAKSKRDTQSVLSDKRFLDKIDRFVDTKIRREEKITKGSLVSKVEQILTEEGLEIEADEQIIDEFANDFLQGYDQDKIDTKIEQGGGLPPDDPPEEPPEDTPQPINMSVTKSEPVKGRGDDRKKEPIEDYRGTTKIDSIPPLRLSTEFKTNKELNGDILYFLKEFGDMLETEAGIYERINKNDKEELEKLHRRIVGKLRPKKGMGERIAVVIDGRDFIREEINRVLMNDALRNIKSSDIIQTINMPDNSQNEDAKDYGDYIVKEGRSGIESVKRMPIYRFIPDVNEEVVKRENQPRMGRINIRTRRRNLLTLADRTSKNDPFALIQRKPPRIISLR